MKIVFAISLLAIIAAATLAFMTRSKFIDTRAEKDQINRQIVDIHEGVMKVNGETESTWKDWHGTKVNAKDEFTQTTKLKRETGELDDTVKQLQKEIDEILGKRTAMEEEIKRIIGRDGTPEEVLAKVDALKGETDALAQELDTLGKELDVQKKLAADSDALSNKLKAQQTARLKAIKLGGRTSTIAAVNQEYSFVVINIGREDGVTSDARLLVKRGGTMLGNLTIVNIDAHQTLANIDLKSVPRGMQILPGDQVVIENAVQ
jgi:predicted RNase H-like nuclease (RuvC/YqgF family)